MQQSQEEWIRRMWSGAERKNDEKMKPYLGLLPTAKERQTTRKKQIRWKNVVVDSQGAREHMMKQ